MDDLEAVRGLLPGVPIEVLDLLGGSHRSVVRRVRAGDRTLIVKEYKDRTDGGWVRESAALAVLPPDAPAPRLVAASADPMVIVMTDVGAEPNLADRLLGTDRRAVRDGLADWATALAKLHRATAGCRESFLAELAERGRGLAVPDDSRVPVEAIEDKCARLGVDLPDGALDELRTLKDRISADAPAALTPGDVCPDNNIATPDGMALIDFEGADWRPVVWDLAYLDVPWPTCWCAWMLPADEAGAAFRAYEQESGLEYLRTPQFRADLAVAVTGWAFITLDWFLGLALGDDPPLPDPAKPMPARRSLLLRRLELAGANPVLPGLAALAGRLRAELVGRWGEVELAPAPVFRGRER